jgi:hypothetical protein
MEKKIMPKKLNLSKKTIVRLRERNLNIAFGGTDTTTVATKKDNGCNTQSGDPTCNQTSDQTTATATRRFPFPFPTR